MNFHDAVAEYDSTRSQLSLAREDIKRLEAERVEAQRNYNIAAEAVHSAVAREKNLKRRLLEAAAKVPGLLHADVSGIVGKLEPADPLKPAPGEGVFLAPMVPEP